MTASTGSGADIRTLMFSVEGMHCASCGLLIDESLEELPGVAGSATDVSARRTVVTIADGAVVPPRVVAETISDLGYAARLVTREEI